MKSKKPETIKNRVIPMKKRDIMENSDDIESLGWLE